LPRILTEFREEAKQHNFAWHTREDGRWVWKTQEEVQDVLLTPVIMAAELDSRP